MTVERLKAKEMAVGHSEILSALHYDTQSGIFRRKITGGRYTIGSVAGNINARGYVQIRICGHRFMAHRLAWFYVHGAWPANEIDHINCNKSDNRIINLREATRAQNSLNSPSRGRLRGVAFQKMSRRNPWFASITVNGRRQYLGCFATQEDAHAAYCEAARAAHGEFARLQ